MVTGEGGGARYGERPDQTETTRYRITKNCAKVFMYRKVQRFRREVG